MKQRLLSTFVALALAGCSQLLGETKTVSIETTTPVLKSDEAIITARLRDHTSTLSPAYAFAARANGADIIAKGLPPEASLQFLLRRRGVFVVKSASTGTWFTNKDIADAQVGPGEQQGTKLDLTLTSEAAARVASLSSNSTGATVVGELDGELLFSAQLTEPLLGGRIQIGFDKTPQEAMLIASILRSGALSFTTSSVAVKDLE